MSVNPQTRGGDAIDTYQLSCWPIQEDVFCCVLLQLRRLRLLPS